MMHSKNGAAACLDRKERRCEIRTAGGKTLNTFPIKTIQLGGGEDAEGGDMKRELLREKTWGNERAIAYHDREAYKATCPYSFIKPELCKAALASLMTDRHYCSSEDYRGCSIFLVNKIREGTSGVVL